MKNKKVVRPDPAKAGGNPHQKAHITRFALRSKVNHPPMLGPVLRELETMARDNYFIIDNKVDIRTMICRVTGLERGPADDYVRLLQNGAVVLHDRTRDTWPIDVDRIPHVRHCAKQCCDFSTPEDEVKRITVLRERGEQLKRRRQSATPSNVITLPTPSHAAPQKAEETTMAQAKRKIEHIEFELGNDVESLGTISDSAIGQNISRFVLYLTPIEFAVWEDIYLHATDVDGQQRLGLPEFGFETDPSWRPVGIDCSIDDYVEALRRFTSTGILEFVGEGKPGIGKAPFKFRYHPDCYIPVRIERRPILETHLEYIEVVRRVQAGGFVPRTTMVHSEFSQWIEVTFPHLNEQTVVRKLYGYNGVEGLERGSWGIVRKQEEGGIAICNPGFEPMQFKRLETPLQRQHRRSKEQRLLDAQAAAAPPATKSAPAPVVTPPAPAPTPAVSPAPVVIEKTEEPKPPTAPAANAEAAGKPIPEEMLAHLDEAALQTRESELRSVIERSKGIIEASEAEVERIQAERKRRKDAKAERLRAQETLLATKKAELQAMVDDIEQRRLKIAAELSEIE